jgi:hypothetical protein
MMHLFRVYKEDNLNVAWITIETGNIDLETGIRMIFSFLNLEQQIISKNLFVIQGDEYNDLGKSDTELSLAIIAKLLEYTNCIIVKE